MKISEKTYSIISQYGIYEAKNLVEYAIKVLTEMQNKDFYGDNEFIIKEAIKEQTEIYNELNCLI